MPELTTQFIGDLSQRAGAGAGAGAGADADADADTIQALRDELLDWQSLHTLSRQLLATASFDEQLTVTLKAVLQIYSASQGSVAMIDDVTKLLVPMAIVGIDASAMHALTWVPVGAGACGMAFEKTCRLVVADTETDPFFEHYRDFSRRNGIRAVCSAPLLDVEGKSVGVISIYLPTPRHPTARELHLTDVCVGYVALLVGRAQAYSALSAERIRSHQVLEAMSDAFVVMDREFRIVQINAAALRIDGRSATEIVGRSHWDVWPGTESLPVGTYYKTAMESRTAVHFEQAYRQNGEERWFEISGYPYADGLALLYADATERKANERAVEESKDRFLQLANAIPQLAWVADKTGYIEWYNERWYDYTGTNLEQMQGWGWAAVHHPDVLAEATARWKESIDTGTAFQMTFPLLGKDGLYRPFFTLVSPLKDAANRVVQWFGTNTDVSAIEAARTALINSEERLKAGLKAGRMAVWDWDLNTNTISSSNNAHELFGYDMNNREPAWQLIHPDDIARLRTATDQAIGDRTDFHEAVRITRPDNHKMMWIEVRGEVICDKAGVPCTIHGITVDVSERAEAQERLTEASRRKDEFLAMLAHELRNPLSPISSAAHLLTIPTVSPALIKQSSQVISRQVGFMTDLIDDLLDVSRVTRGLVVIRHDVLRIHDFLNGAIEQVRPLLDSRQQQLIVELEPGLPAIAGDRTRLVQVLANLINNSAKYTQHGGQIHIAVNRRADTVSICVTDNGIGISAQLLPYVFDLFAQGERTPDRSQGGLGLGLALVKSIVELHHGRVTAASRGLGQGATFEVVLPAYLDDGKVKPVEQEQACPVSARSLRIALVDDNADAAHALASVLDAKGYSTSVDYDAGSLLDKLHDLPARDVFILDIGLPEIDGYALVRQLRTLAISQNARMIALTGYGQSHDRAIGKAAGFDDYFVKPIDIAKLEQILGQLVPCT